MLCEMSIVLGIGMSCVQSDYPVFEDSLAGECRGSVYSGQCGVSDILLWGEVPYHQHMPFLVEDGEIFMETR